MTKRDRTNCLLKHERGGSREFDRLHAILCMHHDWDHDSTVAIYELIDMQMIAERLDEILKGLK